MPQIADAVGIRKASLYSHFERKQAILDALVKNMLEQYAGALPETPDEAVEMIQGQIRYILHDPSISKEIQSNAHSSGISALPKKAKQRCWKWIMRI